MNEKLKVLIVCTIFINLLVNNTLYSQLVNNNADYNTVIYENINGDLYETYVYVFYTPKTGALKAVSKGGDVADFEWYHFDQATEQLLPLPIKTEYGVMESEISNLQEDGYMVIITQNGIADTLRAWVFLDELEIQEIYADNNCNYLRLTARAEYRTNYYWYSFIDVDNPNLRLIQNNFQMQWSADADIRAGLQASNAWQNATASLSTTIDDPAPLADAVYTATITNIFNNTSSLSTEIIPSIGVYADFEVLRPDQNNVYNPTTNLTGEALYKVKFRNKSINADRFTWSGYGNQLINFEKDNIIWTVNTENVDTEVEYTPGQYPVTLTIQRSSSGCTAVTPTQGTILVVLPSSLDPQSIPNAFTPNSDGHNDYFKFVTGMEPVSLEYIDIKIFNRTGLLVYSYNGTVTNWQGWDGRFKGDKGDCEPGVYYYVIKGRGWDDINYSDKTLSGSVHLFR